MPWSEQSPMQLRRRFIAEVQAKEVSFLEVCARYGVSRKTGYKWLRRYDEGGRAALEDRAPIAKHPPHAIAPEIEALVLLAKDFKPKWGPKKLRVLLKDVLLEDDLPAASTMGEVLKRYGLVTPQRSRRRRHLRPYAFAMRPAQAANDVWTADFKGDFALGNGQRCYPFTLEDAHSRYLLECQGMPATLRVEVQTALTRAFREYGLPGVIRTDNGVPFVGTGALAGLSELSVWLLRLGIWLERTRRGAPQDNGRHERMHRTLKAHTCSPPKANRRSQQKAFNAFRREYNQERPHEAIDFQVPEQLYAPSPRLFPAKLPELDYAPSVEVRTVANAGFITWRGHYCFLTKALRGQRVGLTTEDGRVWLVRFGTMPLAYLDEVDFSIHELPTNLKLESPVEAA